MRMTEQITYRLSKAERETLENIALEKNISIGKLIRGITINFLHNENTNSF